MAESGLNPPTSLAFVQAICESDTSAWCFMPFLASQTNCCSRPFRDLWRLPAAVPDASWAFLREQFAEALNNISVNAEEFFAEVCQHRFEAPHRIRLAQNDGVTIHAAVTCVFNTRVGN